MKITRIKLSDLKRPERNVRMHTDKQIKEFKRSVEMFGQIRPIVVDDQHTILAGNGLYDTLLAMGHDAADCYVVTGLSDIEKKKLMLADNRIYSLGTDDMAAFDALIQELKDDLDIPGFDLDLLQSLVADTEEISRSLSEYGSIDNENVISIREAGQRADAQTEAAREQQAQQSGGDDPPSGEMAGRFLVCPSCGEKLWL
jgi:ParB-like chromosome segregation protein Spo0J